ncbi:IclR family transcriptional regulator [Salibacterium halotolerans]|uniref:Glycerol operon regulatory protein n=1 Tax=Salibacterium halotolerans TaxID=1884432 RepID=A0A1I5L9A0_9BACI|nr:IclR family transcriptional regulator [Salibacterium halotolerans]SFO93301.1 DNA-binding transcriptional regulator, IclR family [Salibacterium halotolerans]
MPIIQSVDRALQILDLFDDNETELKITDISERLHLHKSTVHSLLKTLEKHQYIEQTGESGKYSLGMKLFERGNYVIRSRDIRATARDYLYELSQKTNQTVHLVIQDGREGVYIDKVESTSATILYSRIGRRIPLHCSGVGKVLVAFQPDEEITAFLKDYHFVRQTEHTITDAASFWAEIRKVREQGYAEDREENEPGVRCAAVPIYDHNGRVAAALSISTLIVRTSEEEMSHYIEQLKETAAALSKKLGYGF